MVGYGSMLMESAVAIMALIAACILEPGLYFAINSPVAAIGKDIIEVAQTISNWGFVINPEDIQNLAKNIGEEVILSRTGGAPTFAIGLATIISQTPIFSTGSMAFWYHFAILFEALFILTAVDAGTRTCRFMVQDILGNIWKPLGNLDSIPAGLLATGLCVAGWGHFLYQGTIDPKGGIYSLWPLFGVSNQMLACMALLLVTTILFKMEKGKYAWVCVIPICFVFVATMYAGLQKILPANGEKIHDSISHVAFAQNANAKITALERELQSLQSNNSLQDSILQDIESKKALIVTLKQGIINNVINAILCVFFMLVTCVIVLQSLRISLQCVNKTCRYPLKEESYIAIS